ncbi:MmgE/PrpD family protein [Amycolatopsis endophytica]|uniref:2-methylcitrate dehydratase PrpD n=1 Tax=Amycolatopsis endophytica TaxID=860233 RepID=A0A853B245_9PSEU|nr:MmgE/PrpD family protein [Amycolatopsis endophytica]NYI88895.1 2-methylcitrate dehydratase PrpD [Amycolatopsis endophytica]
MTTTAGTAPAPSGSSETAEAPVALLSALAEKTTAVRYEDLDDHARRLVRTAFADTLGVALAGADFAGITAIRTAAGITPAETGSLVLGTADRVPALDAGLLNGVAAHALDLDDGNSAMGGHPSALLVPALLALGEETDATAADIAVAYTAGYEVMIRLAYGLNPGHYQRGWHPTATLGVIGVAAAAARLLGLSAERTATAMAVAVSHAAGVKANFGTMTKSLHVGQAVRNGIFAARLAEAGSTANPGALDHHQGFLPLYQGASGYDASRIVAGLDGPPLACSERNPIKIYPCCHSTHGAIEAARVIRGTDGFDADSVEDIEIVVDPNRMPHTDRPVLTEALSGKFSVQYVTSRALLTGSVVLADFDGDAHRDPATLALMSKVRVRPAPRGGTPNSFAATIRITQAGGSEFTATREPYLPDNDATVDPPVLWEKFADCAGRVLPAERVAALSDALRGFPAARTGVRELARLAEVHPRTDREVTS